MAFTKKIKLYQCCFNVVSTFFNIVSTSDSNVVSTLCSVENPMSDFVSFSKSNQCYFNVNPQLRSNVDPTLKC